MTFMSKNEQHERKLKIGVLVSFAVIAIFWALLPVNFIFNSQSVCFHYKLLGLQCPFCGLSRAAYLLVHLQLAQAWQLNPLIFFIAWLYALEWATLTSIKLIPVIRKFSWWTGLGLVLLIYGMRLTGKW